MAPVVRLGPRDRDDCGGLALRAMVATGMSQREIATAPGVSQSAVSQQLKSASDLSGFHPEKLVEAAVPVLRRLAEDAGYGRLRRTEPRLDDDIRREAVLL